MTLKREEPTIAELEAAVVYLAYVVETFSERYAPILDRMVAELEVARRAESPRERARRILDEAERNVSPAIVRLSRKRSRRLG